MIYKLLVAEDDEVFASVLLDMFANHKNSVQFDATIVHSAADCVKELNQKNYDLVLLDLNLVDSKGELTFLRIYGEANRNLDTPEETRTPIVVLTGSTEEYSKLILKGAMDVIFKPVSIKELHQRLWMAILNFSYRKTKELHQGIESDLQKAKEVLCCPQGDCRDSKT